MICSICTTGTGTYSLTLREYNKKQEYDKKATTIHEENEILGGYLHFIPTANDLNNDKESDCGETQTCSGSGKKVSGQVQERLSWW